MTSLSRFWKFKLPVITNNSKHLFIENQPSVVHLHTMNETVLFRCFSICSDYALFHLEVENLREIFKKNSYPSGIKEQSIKSFLNKLHAPKKIVPTVLKKEFLWYFHVWERSHLI